MYVYNINIYIYTRWVSKVEHTGGKQIGPAKLEPK